MGRPGCMGAGGWRVRQTRDETGGGTRGWGMRIRL
jgi:hypothetical protein